MNVVPEFVGQISIFVYVLATTQVYTESLNKIATYFIIFNSMKVFGQLLCSVSHTPFRRVKYQQAFLPSKDCGKSISRSFRVLVEFNSWCFWDQGIHVPAQDK